MDNIGKAVIVFSLLGIGILYGLSLTSFVEPPYMPLEEVACRAGAHEGELIRTKGVITDFRATDYGNVLMIRENKTELLIFVDTLDKSVGKLNLSYGDVVEVEGRVKTYKGRSELVVHGGHGNAIKKLSVENENIAFVSQIAMHPEDYKGERVSVMGYADNVYKRVFYLADEHGKYLLRVRVEAETEARAKSDDGSIPISALQKGDKIIVAGVFRYDPGNMRYELNLISLRRCS
jgi:DNA/RNA endonuclease YhcR with UshA esterase domain